MASSGRSERRLLTCLFIDVVGSTDLVVRQGPERMKRALDEAFEALRARIAENGGTVEKYIGDAIFAIFGAPVAHADDPARALVAAESCVRWSRDAERGLAVRIGVETGVALVDLGAIQSERQRMAVGACVNIAARLQQHAEPGQVLVGPECREATADVAELASAGSIDLKGIGATPAWSLVSVRAERVPVRLPFVGRAGELARLRDAYARARAGHAQFVLVLGPPGQGKTRLAEEFVNRIADETRVLRARCRPGSELGAQTPLHQLLACDVGQASVDTIRGRVAPLLVDSAESERVAEVLAHTAGISSSERLLSLHALERQAEFATRWREYLEALARERPVTLWVDDLHWADPQLVRLLDRLTFSAPFALFALATARPEASESASLRPGEDRIVLELAGLDDDAGRQLGHSAGALEPHALERAGGNPLFIVELARARSTAGLPATLHGAIVARLDELPQGERELLQMASVAGETFTVRDAALLGERASADVAGTLARLAHLRYLVSVDGAYRFHHPLVHDVAYGRLPIEERMRLHARYAREGAHSEDAEALAHHWWEALKPPDGDWVWERSPELGEMRREALAALTAAGERYAARLSHERAIEVLERALTLAVDPLDAARVEDALANAYQRNSRGDESWAHRLRALELFGSSAQRLPAKSYAEMLQIPVYNFGFFRELPDHSLVLRLLEDGLAAAQTEADEVSLARLLTLRSGFSREDAYLDQALSIIEQAADLRPHAQSLFEIAQELGQSRREISRARAMYARVDDLIGQGARVNESEMLVWRVLLEIGAGNLQEAAKHAERLAQLAKDRSAHLRGHALGALSLVALVRGDWEAITRFARETEELVDGAASEISFCLIAASPIANGAVAEVRAGRAAPLRLRRLMDRTVPISNRVRAAIQFLPEAMQGHADELTEVLDSYERGRKIGDTTIWDPWRMLLLVALVIVEQWDELDPHLAVVDDAASKGGLGAGAFGEAVREERAAARGGPAPTHARLLSLGFHGFSELLGYRPAR